MYLARLNHSRNMGYQTHSINKTRLIERIIACVCESARSPKRGIARIIRDEEVRNLQEDNFKTYMNGEFQVNDKFLKRFPVSVKILQRYSYKNLTGFYGTLKQEM